MARFGLELGRRTVLLALVTVVAGAGALALAVFLSRKVRLYLAGDVLLTHPATAYTVSLAGSEPINHNVRLLTFALQSPQQKLGFRTGQHVLIQANINGRQVVRPYTPVTLSGKKGSFDLMVKVYGVNEDHVRGGVMSQFLDKLKPGDKVQILGPRGHFVYEGRGQFQIVNGRRPQMATQLGLIAAGSGITPILQLLRHLFADNRDQTSVMMIDVNISEQDIIAREELEGYAKNFKTNFTLCHVLNTVQPPEGATDTDGHCVAECIKGPLNKDIMAAHLPPPDPSTLVLCCGPPKLLGDICSPGLRKIGHTTDRVLFF